MKFDSYHPMINLIYFTAVIICTLNFKQPVFLMISLLCAFAYSVKLGGVKAVLLNLCFLLLAFGYGVWYASYHHFGVTTLKVNFIDNQITLEAVLHGSTLGIQAASTAMWFCCIFRLITADKIVYLFGRISPRISLFLSILLRAVPRIGVRAKRIETSREGIGKGIIQGTLWERIRHLISLLSILITWTLEDFVESANSMKSRGYSLKGRTAFSIYRFDNRDRGLVIVFFWCLTVILMAVFFDQTKMYYDPVMILNPITVLSYVFYVVYGVFLLLPMTLQIVSEMKFKQMKKLNE